jgi:hypothetical protein
VLQVEKLWVDITGTISGGKLPTNQKIEGRRKPADEDGR